MSTHAKNRLLLLILVLGAVLAGCSREEPPSAAVPKGPAPVESRVLQENPLPANSAIPVPAVPAPAVPPAIAKIALNEPVKVTRVELASEALAVWRQYAAQQPTLLLFSDQPMLAPVPVELAREIAGFVATASSAELARRSHPDAADVLLLPEMTVDVALREKLVDRLAWALPFTDPDQPLTLEPFRQQLQMQGLATAEEAATLRGDAERLQGMLRGVPVEMATPGKLSPLAGPTILHIDISYFAKLYRSEVATPLLGLVIQTLTELRARKVPVLAVTFSYGNLDERFSLDVRFVGEIVASLFEKPRMFGQPIPVNWDRQDQLLNHYNFFKNEEARALALAQEKALPDSAWVKFNLYMAAATLREGEKALDYLAQAVRRDQVYAVEYLHLARMAYESQRPDEALRMLKLAGKAFPDNPAIQLQLAQLAFEQGDRETAQRLAGRLQTLPWSPVYHAKMPAYLRDFSAYLRTAPTPAPKPSPPSPARQRAPGILPPGHPGMQRH